MCYFCTVTLWQRQVRKEKEKKKKKQKENNGRWATVHGAFMVYARDVGSWTDTLREDPESHVLWIVGHVTEAWSRCDAMEQCHPSFFEEECHTPRPSIHDLPSLARNNPRQRRWRWRQRRRSRGQRGIVVVFFFFFFTSIERINCGCKRMYFYRSAWWTR